MGRLNEILQSGRTLSPKERQRIEEQLARAEEVRAQRQSKPESAAQRQALAFFPLIRDLGVTMSNPYNIAERVLAGHFLANNPIPFVGFWGVGEKQKPDSLDAVYIHRLQEKRQRVANHYQCGAVFTFLLADLHGVFNGRVSLDLQSPYLERIEGMLLEAGFQTRRLSHLYETYGLELPDRKSPIDKWNEAYEVFVRHRDQYRQSARRHDGNKSSEGLNDGYWYIVMRLRERNMLEKAFPNSFLLINGTKMAAEPLMPKSMPVIYLPEGPVWFRKDRTSG